MGCAAGANGVHGQKEIHSGDALLGTATCHHAGDDHRSKACVSADCTTQKANASFCAVHIPRDGSLLCQEGSQNEPRTFLEATQNFTPAFAKRSTASTSRIQKTWRNGAKNGIVPSPTRLRCALRHCAGGSVDGIAVAHRISHTEVCESIWMTMNAMNICAELTIKCPTSHEEQRAIASSFERISGANFPVCIGALDGMLIWIEKPTNDACDFAKCGPKKFFCGRKKKFGLNMQGTCDACGRFLNLCIGHPGSTSGFPAFATSKLCAKVERRGFLAPGTCLFGDNACVNTCHMAAPFKGVKLAAKFDCNHFQSNVRIKIECAFGMLVRRWGILRRPIPALVGLKKTTALVSALCRLHNCCINCTHGLADNRCHNAAAETEEGTTPAPRLAINEAEISSNGGIPMERRSDNEASPEQLSHGGEHFEDVSHHHRQQCARLQGQGTLPRDVLLGMVVEQNLQCPKPAGWKPQC